MAINVVKGLSKEIIIAKNVDVNYVAFKFFECYFGYNNRTI